MNTSGPLFALPDTAWTPRSYSAYRLAVGIVLVYVLWLLVPHARGYWEVVVSTKQHSQRIQAAQPPRMSAAEEAALQERVRDAQRRKLSAAHLESALRQEKQLGPKSRLLCTPSTPDWDYVCRYLPTPVQSTTWLQFGVNVDATRWVEISRVVPLGTSLPSPR